MQSQIQKIHKLNAEKLKKAENAENDGKPVKHRLKMQENQKQMRKRKEKCGKAFLGNYFSEISIWKAELGKSLPSSKEKMRKLWKITENL